MTRKQSNKNAQEIESAMYAKLTSDERSLVDSGKVKASDVVNSKAAKNENGNKLPSVKENTKKVKKMNLTNEQIDAMSMQEVGDALEDASKPVEKPKKASKKSGVTKEDGKEFGTPEKAVKEAKTPKFTFRHSNATECMLGDLTPLDTTGLPNAKYAMREINNEHVEHLRFAYEQGDVLPPLKVVAGNLDGKDVFVVYDGYHRWRALTDGIRLTMADEKGNVSDEKAFTEAVNHYPVDILVRNNVTPRELIKLAFEANYGNGLPISNGGRSRYGMWLIEDARANGGKLSQVDAARIARVEVHALRMYIKRQLDKSKNTKMSADYAYDDEELEDFETDVADTEANSKSDKLEVTVRRLIGVCKSLYKQVGNVQALSDLIVDAVENDEETDALNYISNVLEDVLG